MDSLVVGKLVTTIKLAISFSELNGCSMERPSICQRSVGYQQLRDGLRRLRAALGMPGAVGWVMERLVGTGVEWAFAPNWTVKLEYDFLGLNSLPVISTTGPATVVANGSGNNH